MFLKNSLIYFFIASSEHQFCTFLINIIRQKYSDDFVQLLFLFRLLGFFVTLSFS